MINYTKIKIPKKYQKYIIDVSFWDGMYTLNLEDACDIDGGAHIYDYDTQKELLSELSSIFVISSEAEFKAYYGGRGDIELNDYRESYKKIIGKYPPKE